MEEPGVRITSMSEQKIERINLIMNFYEGKLLSKDSCLELIENILKDKCKTSLFYKTVS